MRSPFAPRMDECAASGGLTSLSSEPICCRFWMQRSVVTLDSSDVSFRDRSKRTRGSSRNYWVLPRRTLLTGVCSCMCVLNAVTSDAVRTQYSLREKVTDTCGATSSTRTRPVSACSSCRRHSFFKHNNTKRRYQKRQRMRTLLSAALAAKPCYGRQST